MQGDMRCSMTSYLAVNLYSQTVSRVVLIPHESSDQDHPCSVSQLQTSAEAFKTPLNAIEPGLSPCSVVVNKEWGQAKGRQTVGRGHEK